MTNLFIQISDTKDAISDIIELVKFASIVWDENTEELSNRCIKVTHKAFELMVCFVMYLMNDGTVSKASNDVLEEMYEVKVGESAKVFEIFVTGFIKTFVEELNKVNLIATQSLEELKLIAKSLKVPSYASFKSVQNLQAAIDRKLMSV